MRFPGPMLEIPWHIQPRHLALDKNQRRRLQRLLIPAAAKALNERGVTIRKPEYNAQYRAAGARPTPRQQWLFDAFRQTLTSKELKKAYERGCIWVSGVARYDEVRRKPVLRPQPRGVHPSVIAKISVWIDGNPDTMDGERNAQSPSRLTDIPFDLTEIKRVYGQINTSADSGEKWVVYTDGSVVQQNGRATGAFAGTFTQGPDAPADFRGRVKELPTSPTRMEAMAIAVAVAITPPTAPLDIHTDSRSAIHMMHWV
jgi:RNase H